MDAQATAPFLRFFTVLKDPRRHNVRHVFTDMLTIAILGLLCRADDWEEVVVWAKARREWLTTFLALPHGIPCADTFERLFARIDPDAFEACFMAWTASLARSLEGQVVAIDGKTLRRSFAHAWDQRMVHLVSAWAAGNQLVLGQLATDAKSNEITAIPALLDLLSLEGATVSIDAMGCQKEIAATILKKKADYVLAVKKNQPLLHEKLRRLLDEAMLEKFAGLSHGHCEQTCGGHGRIETREVWVSDEVKWLGEDLLSLWPQLNSIAVVQSRREVAGKASIERRYFISSRRGIDAAAMASAIREHWGVENRLHWQLDMTFGEDSSRVRKDHGAENLSRLRRLALNLLKKAPGKHSLKNKRFRCSLEPDYLLAVLSQ